MADPTRLELATSAVTGQRSNQLSYESTLLIISQNLVKCKICGADGRDRTCDLLVTNELLYQLSYIGTRFIITQIR